MEIAKDPTIRRIIEERKTYKPTYKSNKADKRDRFFEKPQKGRTLIPPRILTIITNSGNDLQWKVDALNKRERHYERVVKAQRTKKYPIWSICSICGKVIVMLYFSKCSTRCDACKYTRLDTV